MAPLVKGQPEMVGSVHDRMKGVEVRGGGLRPGVLLLLLLLLEVPVGIVRAEMKAEGWLAMLFQ